MASMDVKASSSTCKYQADADSDDSYDSGDILSREKRAAAKAHIQALELEDEIDDLYKIEDEDSSSAIEEDLQAAVHVLEGPARCEVNVANSLQKSCGTAAVEFGLEKQGSNHGISGLKPGFLKPSSKPDAKSFSAPDLNKMAANQGRFLKSHYQSTQWAAFEFLISPSMLPLETLTSLLRSETSLARKSSGSEDEVGKEKKQQHTKKTVESLSSRKEAPYSFFNS